MSSPADDPTNPTTTHAPAQPGGTPTPADPNPTQTHPGAPSDTGMSTAGVLRTVWDPTRQKRFGNYEVVRLIGQGAMGNVFEVLNLSFEPPRREALKVIRSRLRAVAEAVQRFKGEMAKMANLRHANIVAVFHAGTHEGELFFTMSFEEGGDLGELLLREKQLEPRRAAAIIRTVAEAVEEAHRQSIVHRDLKPSNILLRADGAPLVTDFGLAVLMSGSAPSGGDGVGTGPEGTPCYMPPEQAEARHADIGPRSDVYALGAILYECVTGRPPFKGRDAAETIRLVRNAPLDRPRVFNRSIPQELEAICLKCLEKDPQLRYASAGELARTLGEFLDRTGRRSLTRRQKLALWLGVPALVALLFVGLQVWQVETVKSQARTNLARGDELREKGRPVQALEQYAVARERYDSLLASGWLLYGRTDTRLAWADVQLRRGVLLEGQRQYEEAQSALEAAQAALERLRSARADDPRFLNALGEVYHNLGVHYSDVRFAPTERERGLEFYDKAVRLREDVRDRFSGNPVNDRDLARTYGYMGDVLLELDQVDRARHAYQKAEEIRTRLADVPGADVAALCLHARDFGNWSYFYDWNGDYEKAIAAARQRVGYYRNGRFPDRLPGEYLLERASASVTLAELELDRSKAPGPEVKTLLEDALREVRAVGESPDDLASPFAADLFRIHVALAKYSVLKGELTEARAALAIGTKMYDALPNDKRTAEDYYRRAQAFALLAKLSTKENEKIINQDLAQRVLSIAVAKKFRHYYRVQRDRAFDDLRAVDGGVWYRSAVVEPIKAYRTGLRAD